MRVSYINNTTPANIAIASAHVVKRKCLQNCDAYPTIYYPSSHEELLNRSSVKLRPPSGQLKGEIAVHICNNRQHKGAARDRHKSRIGCEGIAQMLARVSCWKESTPVAIVQESRDRMVVELNEFIGLIEAARIGGLVGCRSTCDNDRAAWMALKKVAEETPHRFAQVGCHFVHAIHEDQDRAML